MKKPVFLIAICISFGVQCAQAQDAKPPFRPIEAGDRSLAIEVDPVFNYLGNMFNQTSNNALYLTSWGVVYRKFKSPERALRLRGNLDLQRSSSPSLFLNNIDEQTSLYVGLLFAVGQEYRKAINKWSLYTGFEGILSHRTQRIDFDYTESQQVFFERVIYSQSHRTMAGIGLFAGAEYFISNLIFVGIELNAQLLAGLRYGRNTETEIALEPGNPGAGSRIELIELPSRLEVSGNTGSLVRLRMGLRF